MPINRLKFSNDMACAASHCGRSDSDSTGGTARPVSDESNFTKAARLIHELSKELDAIERDRRTGRATSWELVDRSLSVWIAIKEFGVLVDSLDPRE